MALGNTPRRETNIAVEANKSYAFGVWFKSADNTPIDLTDSVLRFVATENAYHTGAEVISKVAVPMLDQPDMQQFEFQAEDLALDAGSYAYDITLIPPSGYSIPILKGQLEVGANSDLDTDNVFTDISTGTDIIVDLAGTDVVEVTIERVDGLFMLVKELLEDFRAEIAAAQASMDAKVAAAAASAQIASDKAAQLEGWFNSVGFPFWKGTQAEYDAIPVKDPNVLYLIVA
jgi:hypothetical protein